MVPGERVSLRPVTVDDCTPRYVEWLRDPEVNRYLETRWVEQTLETVRAFVEAAERDSASHLLAIIDSETQLHIGNIKIGPVNAHHLCADISYFIGERTFWGRGYATEAVRLASGIGFDRLELHRLQAGIYASNVGSARALEKAGYVREAVFEQQLAGTEGWEDHVWYRLLREEWARL
jgi:[ribosomal protein S5]-alanine N-acetyltransferase